MANRKKGEQVNDRQGVQISKRRISTYRKKKVFIEALNKYHGVIQPALEVAQIDRTTYLNWMRKDEKFAELINNANEAAIDFVESKLYKNIEEGKEISCIFYLKTRAKHRGYVESNHLDVTSGGQKIEFNFGNEEESPEIKINDKPHK